MNDQAAFWNGHVAERWVREEVALDLMMRPFTAAILEAAAAARGEAVIDIGCGCGGSTLALADAVSPEGRVVGLDLSAPMLARARERSAGRPHVTLVEGDAAEAELAPGAFDLLFSRFGVMFFPDPTRAFAHLRRALRPTGRLAFVCWHPYADNPWAKVPFEAVADLLGHPDPTPPDAPGPFAFGDAGRVRGILEDAGFRDIALRTVKASMELGGSGSLADAARQIARVGPVGRLLVDRGEAEVMAAIEAIVKVLPPYARAAGGAAMPAVTWVVTGRNAG